MAQSWLHACVYQLVYSMCGCVVMVKRNVDSLGITELAIL